MPRHEVDHVGHAADGAHPPGGGIDDSDVQGTVAVE